jgi:hypothetical protein
MEPLGLPVWMFDGAAKGAVDDWGSGMELASCAQT